MRKPRVVRKAMIRVVLFDLDGTLLDRHHSLIVYLHQLLNRRVDILGNLLRLKFIERVLVCDSRGHRAVGMKAIWVEDAYWEEPAIADGKITQLSALPDLIDQLSSI